MRLSPHALARNWIVLATAVLTVVPGSAATAAAPIVPKTAQPHVVGGFLPSATRVVPTTARPGARASQILPASVDLRQYAPSPGNQGQVGSCVAWTIGYGIMGYYANRTGGIGAPYAPLFLYLRNVAPGGAPSAGLYPDQVLANAQTAGVDTQADYWQGTTDYRTPPTAAQIANATNYRISGWTRLFNGAGQGDPVKTSIKQALAAGNPVALGIPVYQDFMYLRSHALYNTLTGGSMGGHMIAAFGYDDTGVLIRNSWGTGWGNGGDAKLSWAFITRTAMSAYSVSGIKTPAVAPVPTPVRPAVTAVSGGARGAAGSTVTLTGTGLAGATAVRFGDTPAVFTASTATTLSVTVPVRAPGVADVTVTTPGGTSLPSAATKFTHLPAVPAISSLAPSSGFVNVTTPVVISGTALSTTTRVTADNRAVPYTKINDTTLKVSLPPRAAGNVTLAVTTAGGVSPVTAGGQFTYRALPVPAVTAVTPASGVTYTSTPVIVTGTDLGGAAKVTVDGRPAVFTKISDTSLRVTVPAHPAGKTVLRVVTAGGISGDSAGSAFTYVAPPVPAVAVVAPSSGSGKTTVAVQLTGSGLLSTTRVTANGAALSFAVVGDQQLRVTLPPRPAGQVALVVTTAGGVSAPATYLVGLPAATVRSPGAPLRAWFAGARS